MGNTFKDNFENGVHASFLSWAIGEKSLYKPFKEEIGFDIQMLVGRSGLDVMIDQATGREQELIYSFIVWVTELLWNELEECENIEVYTRAKNYLKNNLHS